MSEYETLVPSFRASIDGSDLPAQAAADLIAAAVYQDVKSPGMFTLKFVNWDMHDRKVTWSDDDLFAAGNKVEIQMGYVDNLEILIVGEITGLEPEFCADEIPLVVVRGYDRHHRLLRGRKTRSFIQMKDSDIAGEIAGDLGLTAEVTDTDVTLEYVLQHNQTDMEFLHDRAWRIGYEIVIRDKTLYFQPYQNTESQVLTLSPNTGLIEFYPRSTTLTQVGQVAVRGWNLADKEKIVGESGTGDETTQMGGSTSGPAAADDAFGKASDASVDWPVYSQAEADQIAKGRFNDIALGYINGEGVCIGRTDLSAGTVIKIEGAGQRFSGLYYVLSATHTFSSSRGYRTAFTVRRNAT